MTTKKVNAGIQTAEEAYRRMLDGEVFYIEEDSGHVYLYRYYKGGFECVSGRTGLADTIHCILESRVPHWIKWNQGDSTPVKPTECMEG